MFLFFQLLSKVRFQGSLLLAGLLLPLALLVTSCRLVQHTAEVPGKAVGMVTGGKKEKPGVDPVEVQQMLVRFADEFATRMVIATDKLRRGTNALEPEEVLKWKIAIGTETCGIASGPNAMANLLDMTVLVTVTRMALEDYWQPNVFGDSAQPMLQGCRSAESNIWRFAEKVLKPEQRTELLSAIEVWRRQNSLPEAVLAARAVGFASQVAAASKTDPAAPGSVFNLLNLDPLAGLDPATREIAQTRLFAERALYVTQKMPMLLRWQTELLSINAIQMPEVRQLVTNVTQVTSSIESFARVADQLPKLVNDQREAAIKQAFEGLASERTNLIASLAGDEMKLRGTLQDLRQTLNAGTELTASADGLVKSVDTFVSRFDKDTNAPATVTVTTNTRPFDILDYAAAAKEVTGTIKELNTAINSLDRAVPQIQKAGDTFEAAGNRLLLRLFLLGAGLIALFVAGGVTGALIYRRAAPKSSSARIIS